MNNAAGQQSGRQGGKQAEEVPSRPDKERVRNWLAQRRLSHQPPPEPAAIRRELGWTTAADAATAPAPAA